MPGFDGTGPQGLGPMTGGGMGYCVSPVQTVPYYRGGGRGFGRGMGRGFGRRAGFPAWGNPHYVYPDYPIDKQQELTMLKKDAEMLKAELKGIHDQIAVLEKSTEQESQ